MTLNKKKMVREIGRRTRVKNRDVQLVIETMIDVWTEELVSGGRIELQNFLVLEVQHIYCYHNEEKLNCNETLRYSQKIKFRLSKTFKQRTLSS